MNSISYHPQVPVSGAMNDYRAKVATELQQAVRESHEVLVTATTVFPLTLFPDTITLDREKLTITRRSFFKVSEVTTMRIEDILNITANVGPFLGSIQITTRFYDLQKPHVVNYFSRDDALKLKRIIQGYVIATQKKIDCSSLNTQALIATLDELGQGALPDET